MEGVCVARHIVYWYRLCADIRHVAWSQAHCFFLSSLYPQNTSLELEYRGYELAHWDSSVVWGKAQQNDWAIRKWTENLTAVNLQSSRSIGCFSVKSCIFQTSRAQEKPAQDRHAEKNRTANCCVLIKLGIHSQIGHIQNVRLCTESTYCMPKTLMSIRMISALRCAFSVLHRSSGPWQLFWSRSVVLSAEQDHSIIRFGDGFILRRLFFSLLLTSVLIKGCSFSVRTYTEIVHWWHRSTDAQKTLLGGGILTTSGLPNRVLDKFSFNHPRLCGVGSSRHS